MSAAHPIRSNRRGSIDVLLVLTGLGVGVAPDVDSGSYLESVTRQGPGQLRLTFKEAHTALLAAASGFSCEDYASDPQSRKKASLGTVDVKGRFVDVKIEDRDDGLQIDEWTDPAAAATGGLKAATATVASVVTVLAEALLTAGKNALLANPRNVTFTTAGSTASDAPATALITGTDVNGDALTETVALSQSAGTAQGVKAFRTITSIVYAAADGTGATVAIGFGSKFGMRKKLRTRAGASMVLKEISAGAVVTNGTFVDPATSAPNGTYTPDSAPDGSKDYAVAYEPEGNTVDLLDGEVLYLTLRLTRAADLL